MDTDTLSALHKACDQYYRKPSDEVLTKLIESLKISAEQRQSIHLFAKKLVDKTRAGKYDNGPFVDLMNQYDLSSEEGGSLMCLAESILRIPDKENITALIQDKVAQMDWMIGMDREDSWLSRMSALGLSMTTTLMRWRDTHKNGVRGLIGCMSMPAIRIGMQEGIKAMAKQFVMAETIQYAIKKMSKNSSYTYSFDMLGEAARTCDMATTYFNEYIATIHALQEVAQSNNPYKNPGLSIKLSSLHPRYTYQKQAILLKELVPKLLYLCEQAKNENLNITIDAEEADRLDLSLFLLEKVLSANSLRGWSGFGLAIQAYQKRAPFVIDWAVSIASRYGQKIGVRLVKGAYWDSEIKKAQIDGLSGYPVFTRKSETDISYLVCAQKLLENKMHIYPQFATHNAYSVAAILEMDASREGYEFQRLYGMGAGIYEALWERSSIHDISCRIYAPIGQHKDLLAYLMRRLLENGANTSFIKKIGKKNITSADLVPDPLVEFSRFKSASHSNIPLPGDLFFPGRQNSYGIDLSNMTEKSVFLMRVKDSQRGRPWPVVSIVNGMRMTGVETINTTSPQNNMDSVARVQLCDAGVLTQALHAAHTDSTRWRMTDVIERAGYLDKAADLLQERLHEFVGILNIEGGKTIDDAIAEVREAIDFCRYYAMIARDILMHPKVMPGPTGETNTLTLEGRGVFLAISPWNFPLAIFIGQVVAALVAGNTVVAKPAISASAVAARAIHLLYEAGIPAQVLHLVCVPGCMIAPVLLSTTLVDGVVFTGSTHTAQKIHQTLAARKGASIVPFIAETGGLNAMIVDSTALLEQAADAVIRSAFQSAGQRCSSLRLLYVQNDIAHDFIEMLKGCMAELEIGDPIDLETDVGPVISRAAKKGLEEYVDTIESRGGKVLYACENRRVLPHGCFMMPCLIELYNGVTLNEEQFGPILHIVRFDGKDIDHIIEEINKSGHGLTLGIQTRIHQKARYILERVRVGNVYVNRDMVGAVVGVQPFGGQALSGTGPKAGGPHYLNRFMTEKTYTEDITASGGNASLLNIELD